MEHGHSNAPTDYAAEAKKANAPPEMITVDTGAPGKSAEDSGSIASEATPSKSDSASQARTPKHANKGKEGDGVLGTNTAGMNSEHEHEAVAAAHHRRSPFDQYQQQQQPPTTGWNSGPPPVYPQQQSGSYPPPHFEQRGHHSTGAFQPRDVGSFPAPMQVSPGGGRYYYSSAHSRSFGGYEQRYPQGADFSMAQSYPQQPPRGGGGSYPPMYPPQYSGSFDGPQHRSGPPPPSWGSPSYGRPPYQAPVQHPDYRSQPQHVSNSGNFSRAVSSSFDRSIKSSAGGHEKMHGVDPSHSPKVALAHAHHHHHAATDSGSVSEDASWGALKQVHSVDEEEMRKRLSKRKDTKTDVVVNEPTSNSSSLTNSPTAEHEKNKAVAAAAAGQPPSSLDSLSSVASAQEPLDTSKVSKVPSPDGSAPSLELMKCPSGTSALLLPSHQRSLSHFSLSGMESKDTVKRESDYEEREGMDDDDDDDKTEGPSAKKARIDSDKKSPLSISCSPPTTPGGTKKKAIDHRMHQPQPRYPTTKESPAFYDKPPSYSYSMESAPPMPHGMPPRPESYPNIPQQRPGSSASSTITPMNVDGHEMRHPPAVGQMPSWELHGQDSFGGASVAGVGGGPLMGSLSFYQDYPIGPSSSMDHGHSMPGPPPPHMHPPPHVGNPNQTLESRNQSFEGGHYHGSFARSDSMMSYEAQQRQMSFDHQGRYQGSFPPHAPSWGSASSYPQGYGGPPMHQRMGYPPMMRNYSDDSGARASPPPGGMRMMPPNFPPPPEFRAPPSMVNSKGGHQNTIMTSPYHPNAKVGPFGWSKEEDDRLTEIMKKYKNPRDWDPIAKEHNRGRT